MRRYRFRFIFCCFLILLTGWTTSASAKNYKWGYINTAGKLVISPAYNNCCSFVDGLARVQDIGWGWIDKSGKRLIPFKFARANDFAEGVATVELSGKWGVIDKKGKFVVEPRFEELGAGYQNGIVAAKLNNMWGFIDKRGDFVLRPKYDEVRSFHEDMAAVNSGGRWGFVNRNFVEILKPQSASPTDFHEERAACQSFGGKWGFIDTHGNWITKPVYRSVGTFSEGLAWVTDGTKFFFIDKDGKVVANFAPDVTNVQDMHEGLAAAYAAKKGGAGYVDRDARFVIKPQFTQVENFFHGVARVSKERGEHDFVSGLIDRDCAFLLPMRFKEAHNFVGNLALVQEQPDRYGYADKSGTLVIPDKFVYALDFQEGLAAVQMAK